MQGFQIRPAVAADIPVVLSLIREMAAYERASDSLAVNEALLKQFVFCERPYAEVFLGCHDDAAVSYAIVLPKFYSYQGRPNLYLEDLYVQPHLRRQGIGEIFMRYLAKLAVARGCPYLEWCVLNWNKSAIGFYNRWGARRDEERSYFYLDDEALRSIAGDA